MGEFDRVNIYGFNETGKSTWLARFLEDKEYIVWSPNPDESYVHAPKQLKIVYRPKNQFDIMERRKFFRWIMNTKAFHGRGVWVCFDEAHNAWPNPPVERMEVEVKQFITSGRHRPYNFNMAFIALTPQDLDFNIQRKPLRVICFRIGGDLSVQKLNRWQSGMGDAAADLENYQYVEWSMNEKGFKIREPVVL